MVLIVLEAMALDQHLVQGVAVLALLGQTLYLVLLAPAAQALHHLLQEQLYTVQVVEVVEDTV